MNQFQNLLERNRNWLYHKLCGGLSFLTNKYNIDEDYMIKNIEKNVSNDISHIIASSMGAEEVENYIQTEAFNRLNGVIKICSLTFEVSDTTKIFKSIKNIYRDFILYFVEHKEQQVNYIISLYDYFDRIENSFCQLYSESFEKEINFNALDKITSGIIFVYNEKGNIYTNKGAEELTGYTSSEMKEMKFEELLQEEYRDKVQIYTSTEGSLNQNPSWELKIKAKNGEEKWIEFNICEVTFEQENVIMGIAFDISKRKKMEEDLKESEGRYKTLLELMPDAVFVHGDKGITYTNNAGAKLMAMDKKDIIGKKGYTLLDIDPYEQTLIQQQEDILKRRGKLPPVERKYRRKSDNKLLEVETTSAIVHYKEKAAIINITRDVSERKKIQMLKEKVKENSLLLKQARDYDKIKTEFFANISHELRTPLNIILGILQVLDRLAIDQPNIPINDPKMLRYRKVTKQNCFRLVRLVNNLIDITKIDAGYMSLNLKRFNIVNVVEDISLSVAEYVQSKGISLVFDTNVEEKYMSVDPDKLERIILNLLSNAVKFTEVGGHIEVNLEDLGDKIRVSVKDSGVGIPFEKQKEVFQRFIQVDKSLSRNREGSGIGLSLVKAFIDMHKGNIHIKSESGKGSEFIIELPTNLCGENSEENISLYDKYSNIEMINLEFSDIYSC